MPEYKVNFIDKMGKDVVAIGGAGWVYTADEAGFLIKRGKADFYVQVGEAKAAVKAVPHEGYGRHWDLTTEGEENPSNDLHELPIRNNI